MAKLRERYANALLALSEENGTLAEDLQQAILIRDTLKKVDLQSFLLHPQVPDATKEQFFRNTFAGSLSGRLLGFLSLMVRKNREVLILPVLAEYIDLANRRLGIIEAKVVSAVTLTEKQREAIRTVLTKKTGMQVELKAEVDPGVLGGFYILIAGRIFDRTVRSDLHLLRDRLKRGGYA
ncbi:MAG TPA: ATP synthase F1 subunit delta [Firmicutes bacterium]|jgi:F-type H+-transporting ATPase subunit delta|nr:ATP synthase F1 subunit delta [Bacillota bacterium]